MFVNGPIWLAATVSGSTVKKKKENIPITTEISMGQQRFRL